MRWRGRNDAGSSLVEVLVATAVMGTAVVALVTGMSTLVNSSSQNRDATTASVVARDYAEALDLAVAQPGAWCSSSYSVSYTPPSGYTVTPALGACPASTATTPQLQTATLTVTAPSGDVETLRMVVRAP